ncbi:Ribonucleoside-diphosphate reductase small chain A [Dendrobium catenatum]|uniref:Ribonucleoside-diphosphate reductase small chain A n=1 Tax=Dendrobium catenatum TaxID=906689 RepID=A0A2I0W4D0_9ASPA|nr:Ribonucleoside-diphosphate reductase small chain A [Dendrobium catenatum]
MFKRSEASFWTLEEVDLFQDLHQQSLISNVLSFFVVFDRIIIENLADDAQNGDEDGFFGGKLVHCYGPVRVYGDRRVGEHADDVVRYFPKLGVYCGYQWFHQRPSLPKFRGIQVLITGLHCLNSEEHSLHCRNFDQYWSYFLRASKIERENSCLPLGQSRAKGSYVHLKRAKSSLSCWSRVGTCRSARSVVLPQIRLEGLEALCALCKGLIKQESVQGEDLGGLDVKALEEMQNCHVEALSKICQEKVFTLTVILFVSCSLEAPFFDKLC